MVKIILRLIPIIGTILLSRDIQRLLKRNASSSSPPDIFHSPLYRILIAEIKNKKGVTQ